ncbi:MAG: cyclic beta 1-2 glucan synthetase, partial [Limisphaerales bacterium]
MIGKTQDGIEQPLRGELFGLEQLERHARSLAGQHKVTNRKGPNQLLVRLSENEQLLRAYNLGTAAAEKTRRITPAAEWLLDNFYLIKEQIHLARRHLPKGYNRELPRLLSGPSAGYPRVYDIALELITHVDGRIDVQHLSAFVAAYQNVSELKLGELWGIPIMLRLALIENLRRLTAHLLVARQERDLADEWVDKMLAVSIKNASDLIIVVSDLAKSDPPLTSAFAAEFVRRIQGENPGLQFARHWLEQRFSDHGLTLDHLVQMESQNQAADQVSIGNSITSLRSLGAMDWKEFIETMSVVETALRGDPIGIYGEMDFATRDYYRHSVEKISRRSALTEKKVAEKAIEFAARSENKNNERKSHVGFYLVEKGLPELEKAAQTEYAFGDAFQKKVRQSPLFFYVGSIGAFTLLITWSLWQSGFISGLNHWQFVLFLFLPLLGASHLAVAIVNWLATLFLTPRLLPRLDFSQGIPAEHRTMVVVPTLLTSLKAIDRLLEGLEIHYLSNRDDHLHFALLTDFKDGPQQTMPLDEALLRRARNGILTLNEKYRNDRAN